MVLHNWLEINVHKTKCVLFSTQQLRVTFPENSILFGNCILNEDLNTTLLCVKINKTLKWDEQIDKICIALGFVNSVLFTLKMESVPTIVLLIVYKI